MSSEPNQQRFRELLDLVLEGGADAKQMDEFERLVLADSKLTQETAAYLSERASLSLPNGLPVADLPQDIQDGFLTRPKGFWQRAGRSSRFAWASAAVLLVVCTWFGWRLWVDASVATLVDVRDCRWAASEYATISGERLGQGRMRLVEGIAKIDFDRGVEVTLEGPADFEILDEMTCMLHSGRIFSSVRAGGEGFIVRTPSATYVDRGTIFGVQVDPEGVSELQVFQGRVDVSQVTKQVARQVLTGQAVSVSKEGIVPLDKEGRGLALTRDSSTESRRLFQISTAVGGGDDAFVHVRPSARQTYTAPPDTLLLKNPGSNEFKIWTRRVLLKFDLSLLPSEEIMSATLQVTTVPTGMGYATLQPDTRVAAFGVTSADSTNWSSADVTWETAPGYGDGPQELAEDDLMALGTFMIPQSARVGTFTLGGKALAEFLRQRANETVTVLLVSQTAGTGSGYVHGIASRSHPSAKPPTLQIQLADRDVLDHVQQ